MLAPFGLAGIHPIEVGVSSQQALKRPPSARRFMLVADLFRLFVNPGYHRNTRGPSTAPASVGIAMPRTYQTARKGAVDSGQWSV